MNDTTNVGPQRILAAWDNAYGLSAKSLGYSEWEDFVNSVPVQERNELLLAIHDVINNDEAGRYKGRPKLHHLRLAFKLRTKGAFEEAKHTFEGCSRCGYTGKLGIILFGDNWQERPCSLFNVRLDYKSASTGSPARKYWRHIIPCGCEMGRTFQKHTGFDNQKLRQLTPYAITRLPWEAEDSCSWNAADTLVLFLQAMAENKYFNTPFPDLMKYFEKRPQSGAKENYEIMVSVHNGEAIDTPATRKELPEDTYSEHMQEVQL